MYTFNLPYFVQNRLTRSDRHDIMEQGSAVKLSFIIENAKKLIEAGETNYAGIAEACGYYDSHSLNVAFEKMKAWHRRSTGQSLKYRVAGRLSVHSRKQHKTEDPL